MNNQPGTHPRLDELLAPSHRTTAHVASCRRCRDQQAALAAVASDLGGDDFDEPPRQAVARASLLLAERPQPAPGIRERLAELVRTLATPLPAPALAGVRGPAPVEDRLLFRSEETEVEVVVDGGGASCRVTGQVVGGDTPIELARVERAGRTLAETPVDGNGLFLLSDLPPPPFELVLDRIDERLRLPVSAGDQG